MRRYSSSPALGNTVRLKLDSVTESLLRSATSRSGRSRGFEVFLGSEITSIDSLCSGLWIIQTFLRVFL